MNWKPLPRPQRTPASSAQGRPRQSFSQAPTELLGRPSGGKYCRVGQLPSFLASTRTFERSFVAASTVGRRRCCARPWADRDALRPFDGVCR